jgi:dTDP-4-dehydrorhamnose 3,5-epimerase
MEALRIEGTYLHKPDRFVDPRGTFHMMFHRDELVAETGYALEVAQVNLSVSSRGALRGIHFADVPPGQAKYVSCVRGAVLDVVVDIRVGSPTFGEWEAVPLDDEHCHSVFIAEGLGHAFFALTDDAAVNYFCSEPYNPSAEHGLNPLDPAIGIAWPAGIEPLLSKKDAEAISLAEAVEAGTLPDYERCREHYATRAQTRQRTAVR